MSERKAIPDVPVVGATGPETPALGHTTSHGFAWMVGQTLLAKLLSVVGQIVLAWYLVRDDFGLVILAQAVASFPSLLRDAGMQQILVYRHKHFHRWAGPVFWMSLALGVTSGLILAVIAPVAADFLEAPRLTGLILLLATASPITALATVPAAKLLADLRYKFQAVLALAMAVATTALTIVLARLDFGPYSVILPIVLTSVGRTVALWVAAPFPISTRLQVRRWRFITGDSGVLLCTAALAALVANGDYLILGFFHDPETVGIFFFAFNLSTQALALLAFNLGSVLFPALRKLQSDPPRQIDAFLRATRVFAAIAIPFGLLQAAASDPGFRLIFDSRWYPSIPIMQILSVGMAIRTASLPAYSLAAAQHRIRFNLLIFVCTSAVFLSAVTLAAKFSGSRSAVAVAAVETLFFAVSDPIYVYLLMRMNGRGLADVARIYTAPLIAGAIAAAFAGITAYVLPVGQARGSQMVRLAAVVCVMALLYLPLLRWLAADVWRELSQQFRSLLPPHHPGGRT